MIFENVDQLLHMNGHGAYVWASYGAAVIVLGWLVTAPLLRNRKLLADIARQARRDAAAPNTARDGEN